MRLDIVKQHVDLFYAHNNQQIFMCDAKISINALQQNRPAYLTALKHFP